MSVLDPPSWCRTRRGRNAVLLIAPHGGAADTSTARALDTKVNDVHTAELTWTLAESLDASAIVNATLDRNLLDLNRISQVTRDAPWFAALIEDMLATLLDVHPCVEVLFIHGWNVIQPKCDIGVGAHFESTQEAASLCQLTVDSAYARERLPSLHRTLERVGVHVTFGERYPASHRNNFLQLFRRDGSRPCPAAPRIAEWAARGRINAVQLELGVPLRWPGRLRDAFAEVLTDEIADAPSVATIRQSAVVPHDGPVTGIPDPVPPTMLLTYDARARIGFLSGISLQPDGHLGARLLVFTESQTMALFTGEDPATRGRVIGGPHFNTRGNETDLQFKGPILEVRDAAAYVRLEQAFRQSRLVDAELHATFDPGPDAHYGRVRGTLRLEATTYHVNALGFRDAPIFLRRTAHCAPRCAAAFAFAGEHGVQAVSTDRNTVNWIVHAPRETHTGPAAAEVVAQLHPEIGYPQRIVVDGGRLLVIDPVNRMQIQRPLPNGGSEMIYLGLARATLDGSEPGFGFYEYVRPVE